MKKIVLLILISIFAILAGCMGNPNTNVNSSTDDLEQKSVKPLFEFKETSYDFGVIKQSGGKVTHDFEFTYNGDSSIKVTGVPTSCACTSASIDKTILNPGDKATIKVTFNPNLHGEPQGKFFKTISILTEPKVEIAPEVKIWAQIDLDLGPDAFELKDNHNDDGHEDKVPHND